MGLRRECDKEEFSRRVSDGTVEELLKFHEVSPGDVFFIPAGTIHAIGAGVVIYEIQQNSTLTYRLYDYKRKDKSGNERELHVDKAMLVASLEEYKKTDSTAFENGVIGRCEYFETREYKISSDMTVNVGKDTFLSLTVIDGELYADGESFRRGDSFFAPAGAGEIALRGNATCITVSIPG